MSTSEIETSSHALGSAEGLTRGRGLALPAGLVFVEQVAAALRRYLTEEGLDSYALFNGHCDDLHDLDRYVPTIDPGARWVTQEILTGDADSPAYLARGAPPRLLPSGLLVLSKYNLVISRRYWLDGDGDWQTCYLCAAESESEYDRLRQDIRACRNDQGAKVWQVVSGPPYKDGERIVRTDKVREPLLPKSVKDRIHCDIIQFFSEEVAELHRAMKVPYRRGVLLYGPPGNGKTSTIRYVGVMLPRVPGLILRPKANFDSDDFETVVNRWRRMAPAILVVEDLNWLLKSVNLSTFLNLLDGVDATSTSGGLLLFATTNYPEHLDPAINSRPGRFDVVIEIPPPDATLRTHFLERFLDGVAPDQIATLVEGSDQMSFAHLEEIVRLSGLLAIRAGRKQRFPEDFNEALSEVRKGLDQADRGFARDPEIPFGLRPRNRD
jgi:hypothetical protein